MLIYTVTMNPSLDYILTVDNFKAGAVNRADREQVLPGGKGINVSAVLKNLEMDTKALFYTAGFVGDEIRRLVRENGIPAEAVPVQEGCSRINVKVLSKDETQINAGGPDIREEDLTHLYAQLDTLKEGDVLVLAGSVPASLPRTIYRDVIRHVEGKGILTVVDAMGDLLRETLSEHPFLIKPNREELEDFFLVRLTSPESVVPYAKRLQEMGAKQVLISLGGDGAVFIAPDGSVTILPAPHGEVVNTVGAGDAMIAGFLYGWSRSEDPAEAFRMGLAAGSASAFSENLATKDEILKVYEANY